MNILDKNSNIQIWLKFYFEFTNDTPVSKIILTL